jgi:hypothetical protein
MRTEFSSREGEDLVTVPRHASPLEEMITNLPARMEFNHLLALPEHARCDYATRRQLPMSTYVTHDDNPPGLLPARRRRDRGPPARTKQRGQHWRCQAEN